MRILLMGDFSGRRSLGIENPADLGDRRTVAVDIDNFDQRLARLAPGVVLPVGAAGGPGQLIEFNRLDDFHPDSLYGRLDLFRGLRDTRARLQDPATFEQAAAELCGDGPTSREPPVAPPASGSDAGGRGEDDTATLERLLGPRPTGARQAGAPALAGQLDITALIRGIVAPYVTPAAPAMQGQYLAWVDAATSEQMRGILHHPAFQGLESLWRSVRSLVSSLELDASLQLHLLDVTKAELMAHLHTAGSDLESCALYRMLVEQAGGTLGGEPWSLLVGDYTFGSAGEDLELLATLGALGSQAGAPFLAAADPSLLGCSSLVSTPDPRDWYPTPEAEQRFQALRASAIAPWIGLALPRVLLRLPYGMNTDRVEHLDFEELTPVRSHEAYLWGNPALACAMLIGQSFLARGWEMEPGDDLDLVDLPAHVFERHGERHLQPCAEVLLSERAGEAILGLGLMPLLSYKNRNAIRLMRFQSIAAPSSPLSGPWR
jgi:type VI secretion system protein ImpC